MFRCEVCDTEAIQVISIRVPNEKSFGKCSNCGLFQQLGFKLPSQIEGSEFDGYLSAQDEQFEKTRRELVLLNLKKFLDLSNLELSVYDIGTGNGNFLNDAHLAGFSVEGSELSHTAAAIVKDKYGFEVDVKDFENLGFADCKNSVTMFCVLAHSVHPISLLNSIHKSLRYGGILYFHTPKYCFIDSIAIIVNNISFGKVNQLLLRRIGGDHKRIYSRKSLLVLLRDAGFTDIFITPEIGYGLKKEHYFMAMGMPKRVAKSIAIALNLFAKINLLPKNVFSVYAIKKNH